MTQLPIGTELFAELIADLIDLTNEGKVEWEVAMDEGMPYEYEVDIQSWNVDLRSADGDGQVPFVLRIFKGADLQAELDSRTWREFNSPLTSSTR
ncbi:hypothetical protein [Aeromicrobium sp. UC242_57]|uniref:hypothetical protein n=1 Tax=Aeromicrobium sp. UC242_57 TaxID=3374624 RepID=UPI0037972550